MIEILFIVGQLISQVESCPEPNIRVEIFRVEDYVQAQYRNSLGPSIREDVMLLKNILQVSLSTLIKKAVVTQYNTNGIEAQVGVSG